MILTDTSFLIEQQRRPSPKRVAITVASTAAVCGVTVAEFFAGVRTAAQEASVRNVLAYFQRVPIPEAVWEAAGRNQAALRSRGVVIPLPDTVNATVAIHLGVELWTYDAHFALTATVLPALRLFQEPP